MEGDNSHTPLPQLPYPPRNQHLRLQRGKEVIINVAFKEQYFLYLIAYPLNYYEMSLKHDVLCSVILLQSLYQYIGI